MFVIFSNFIPGAHGAGEAVEVVGVVLGPPHDVGREDARAAATAFRPKRPEDSEWTNQESDWNHESLFGLF